MAKQTWTVDRKKGGTYSFKLDAQGNYTLQKDGFEGVNTLNLPELKAEAAKTTTQDTTKDVAKLSAQTQKAFGDVQPFYYQGGGKDASQYTTEYDMVKDKSLDTSQPMVAGDTFAQARQKMTTDEAYRGVTPSDRQPGFEVANKGITKQDTIPEWAKGVDKRGYENINKDISVKATDEIGRQNVDQVLDARTQVDRFGTGQWGPKPSSGMPITPSDRQPGFEIANKRVSPQKATVSETALKKVNTASNTLFKTVGGFLKGGGIVGGVVRSIAGPPTATQTHAKEYFNVRDDGRIAGNPATDLYAGMNRVSAFGNLEKSGAKRIDRLNKTINNLDKNWSNLKTTNPKAFAEKKKNLIEKRNKFERQQDSYVRDKHEAVAKDAVKKGADPMNPSEMRAASIKASNEKGNSGNGNTRVICTELHRTGEMSTVDWIRDTRFTFKTLTQKHVKGYLFWAVPTVKLMKKYPLYRKIWKHLAQHRANDIAWRLDEGKFDLLGRIYAGIGEPLCWLIGNCVSNKHIKEFNIKNWRRV